MNAPILFNLVVVGGTGLVGKDLLAMAHSDERFMEILSIQRRTTASQRSDKTKTVICKNFRDLTDLTLPFEVERPLLAFCTLGSTIKKAGSKEAFREIDQHHVVRFAKLVLQNKAVHLGLVSATGADTGSLFFYNQVKGAMEKEVSELPLTSLAIYQPSLLAGPREEFRLGESLAKPFMDLLPLSIRTVQSLDLAAVMLNEGMRMQKGKKVFSSKEIQIRAQAIN